MGPPHEELRNIFVGFHSPEQSLVRTLISYTIELIHCAKGGKKWSKLNSLSFPSNLFFFMYSQFRERHHNPADELDCQLVCFLSHMLNLLPTLSHLAHWVHHLHSEDSQTSSLFSTPAQSGLCICHVRSHRSKCILPMTGLLTPCFNGFCTCEEAISYHIKLGNVYMEHE